MKVIIDDKIPYIQGPLKELIDEVIAIPGKEISAADVKSADALFVRTRTHCNETLLEGSSVRFIATATIGYDHIDEAYCKANNITWANAPGSNSSSVAQYIESVFILLEKKGVHLKNKTIGVVGGGNVGKKIISLSEKFGLRVLLNDLPRAEVEEGTFYSLSELAEASDIITFHVPLYKEGRFKTFHLGDQHFFHQLRRKPIIINTSRGEVLETEAVLRAIDENLVGETILDVWENEPHINLDLLNKTFIGTPHIAGYSADGKANASQMALNAFCEFFGLPSKHRIVPPSPINSHLLGVTEADCLLEIYNPMRDNDWLKGTPSRFEFFRGNYPLRREKQAYTIELL